MNIWGPNQRIKTLATGVTRAQIERAQLGSRLLKIEPAVTALEAGSMWLLCRAEMERADAERQPTMEEAAWKGWLVVSSYAKGYFDKYCQDFIRDVCKSSLDLTRDQEAFKEQLDAAVDADAAERAGLLLPIFVELAGNSLKLTSANLDVVNAMLTPWEKKKALAYASSLVIRENGLNQFEVDVTTRFVLGAFS